MFACLLLHCEHESCSVPSCVTVILSTCRGIQQHKFVHPLDIPGEADLSADVDFSALRCGCLPTVFLSALQRWFAMMSTNCCLAQLDPSASERGLRHLDQLTPIAAAGVRLQPAAPTLACMAPSRRQICWRRWASVCGSSHC